MQAWESSLVAFRGLPADGFLLVAAAVVVVVETLDLLIHSFNNHNRLGAANDRPSGVASRPRTDYKHD